MTILVRACERDGVLWRLALNGNIPRTALLSHNEHVLVSPFFRLCIPSFHVYENKILWHYSKVGVLHATLKPPHSLLDSNSCLFHWRRSSLSCLTSQWCDMVAFEDLQKVESYRTSLPLPFFHHAGSLRNVNGKQNFNKIT